MCIRDSQGTNPRLRLICPGGDDLLCNTLQKLLLGLYFLTQNQAALRSDVFQCMADLICHLMLNKYGIAYRHAARTQP